MLVNAAGPWVADFIDTVGVKRKHALRLVKGSHIIVPKLFDGAQAYILQNDDRRIVFAIPYEQDFTLIGTTDLTYEGDPAQVRISAEETDYLCSVINRYFKRNISPADVVRTYSGVRPLYDDAAQNASAVTRDYVFEVDTGRPAAAVDLRRQDHHLPQTGGTCAGPAPRSAAADGAGLDRRRRAARRRHA